MSLSKLIFPTKSIFNMSLIQKTNYKHLRTQSQTNATTDLIEHDLTRLFQEHKTEHDNHLLQWKQELLNELHETIQINEDNRKSYLEHLDHFKETLLESVHKTKDTNSKDLSLELTTQPKEQNTHLLQWKSKLMNEIHETLTVNNDRIMDQLEDFRKDFFGKIQQTNKKFTQNISFKMESCEKLLLDLEYRVKDSRHVNVDLFKKLTENQQLKKNLDLQMIEMKKIKHDMEEILDESRTFIKNVDTLLTENVDKLDGMVNDSK